MADDVDVHDAHLARHDQREGADVKPHPARQRDGAGRGEVGTTAGRQRGARGKRRRSHQHDEAAAQRPPGPGMVEVGPAPAEHRRRGVDHQPEAQVGRGHPLRPARGQPGQPRHQEQQQRLGQHVGDIERHAPPRRWKQRAVEQVGREQQRGAEAEDAGDAVEPLLPQRQPHHQHEGADDQAGEGRRHPRHLPEAPPLLERADLGRRPQQRRRQPRAFEARPRQPQAQAMRTGRQQCRRDADLQAPARQQQAALREVVLVLGHVADARPRGGDQLAVEVDRGRGPVLDHQPVRHLRRPIEAEIEREPERARRIGVVDLDRQRHDVAWREGGHRRRRRRRWHRRRRGRRFERAGHDGRRGGRRQLRIEQGAGDLRGVQGVAGQQARLGQPQHLRRHRRPVLLREQVDGAQQQQRQHHQQREPADRDRRRRRPRLHRASPYRQVAPHGIAKRNAGPRWNRRGRC